MKAAASVGRIMVISFVLSAALAALRELKMNCEARDARGRGVGYGNCALRTARQHGVAKLLLPPQRKFSLGERGPTQCICPRRRSRGCSQPQPSPANPKVNGTAPWPYLGV